MATIRSSRVVIEAEVRPATLRIESGVVAEVGVRTADHDFGDAVVMPGLVDSHVHVNEPGRTHWEGFASATRAAAAGGTTTIVDMPLNSVPPTTDPDALNLKKEAARGQTWVDVAFWGGLVPGSRTHLGDLIDHGVCGFKSFLVDSGVPEFPPLSIDELRSGLNALGERSVPMLIHAESANLLLPIEGDEREYGSYLASRPVESEASAVQTLSNLASDTGATVHVLHVSSGEAAGIIGSGPPSLSGETCPHYLTFAAEDIPHGATRFKCTPPIREAVHREALWEALGTGSLAMVVSDHSPAPADLKRLDSGSFADAWGGISSLQLRLPATWTGAVARGFGLTDLTEWLSTAPAGLAGLDGTKGSIGVGKDADLVIWDPDDDIVVRGSELHHRHPTTPYEGMSLRGRVLATLVRGDFVYEEGRIGPRHGRMLKRS